MEAASSSAATRELSSLACHAPLVIPTSPEALGSSNEPHLRRSLPRRHRRARLHTAGSSPGGWTRSAAGLHCRRGPAGRRHGTHTCRGSAQVSRLGRHSRLSGHTSPGACRGPPTRSAVKTWLLSITAGPVRGTSCRQVLGWLASPPLALAVRQLLADIGDEHIVSLVDDVSVALAAPRAVGG